MHVRVCVYMYVAAFARGQFRVLCLHMLVCTHGVRIHAGMYIPMVLRTCKLYNYVMISYPLTPKLIPLIQLQDKPNSLLVACAGKLRRKSSASLAIAKHTSIYALQLLYSVAICSCRQNYYRMTNSQQPCSAPN